MLLTCDSFDHYATADFATRGWTLGSNPTIAAVGRNGTNGLHCLVNRSVWRTIPNTQTVILGVAICPRTVTASCVYLQLLDGATVHIQIATDASSRLVIKRGDGTALETSTYVPTLDAYFFLELKVKIDDGTSGTWAVRVNGVEIMSDGGSGGDTRNGANAYANVVWIGSSSAAGSAADFDDFTVCDNSGSYNNDFLGDVRVYYSPPTADGSNTAWTASGGTDESCVDEAAPNGDTDYIASLTPGQIDSFTFDALPLTGTVLAVQTLLSARKDDAGSRSIREHCRSGGNPYSGATKALGDSYLYHSEIREVDPDTAAPWDIAGVDAAELGVELVS